MKININVNIYDSNLLSGLKEVLNIIDQISRSDDAEDTLCFQENTFVTPLFILPLLVYVSSCNKTISYEINSSYIDTISFGSGGIHPEILDDAAFVELLKKYSCKSYLPIINFPATLNYNHQKNIILTAVENMLVLQLGLRANITAGIKYIIEESVDNIIEHSDSERGYIFIQSYPTKKFLDICIADSGITLLGSYRKTGNTLVKDHLTAIQAANKGISTKNLPAAENRGYGIVTSKKMLVNGLSGNYLMLSGNALHIHTKSEDSYISLPPEANWHGTIVALRIPYLNDMFNYINYVE